MVDAMFLCTLILLGINESVGFQGRHLTIRSLTQIRPQRACGGRAPLVSKMTSDQSATANTSTGDLSMGTLPMTREIAALALPALGGMLLDPLMSLVDTACVGQVSTLQLASLAPCTSIYQFFFVLFFFLSITTTTLVAANSPDASHLDEEEVDRRIAFNEKVVSCATLIALVGGILTTIALFVFSCQLMSLAGCTGPEMMFLGVKYLKIRALGLPFVLVATVLQGASLGRQDSWTPFVIFFAAGTLNLIGDVWLTLHLGWGVVGAAIATLISQVTATMFYTYRSLRLPRTHDKGVRLIWTGIPDRKLIQQFMSMAIALFLKCITTMSCYSLMTKTASTFGALSLAAHQVTLQVWWLLSYFPEPASTAAQSLVARDLQERPERIPKLVKVLYCISFLAGIIVAAVTGLVLAVPVISNAIVADPTVRSLLRTTALPAMLAQVLCAVGSLSDGLAVGCGNFQYLPLNSAIGLLNLTIALKFMRHWHVAGVWMASCTFFASRIVGHMILSKKLRMFLFHAS